MTTTSNNMLPTVNWLMGLTSTSTGLKAGLDMDQKGRRCRSSAKFGASSAARRRGSRATPYDRAVPQYWSSTSDNTEDGEDLDASRPQFSFTCLIGLAVLSSPEKRLSVGQVYEFISKNFPFYKTAKGTWRNSVRHVLSLNKFFQKVAGGPAKGGVWEIKPRMVAVLLEHIAEGQQRLPVATCRHLGLPQLKKRVIKSRIGRGRTSWSACTDATTDTQQPSATSERVASKRPATFALPPPPPPFAPASASATSWDSIAPLSIDFDMDELATLAALESSLASDDFEPSSPGSESMCSTSSFSSSSSSSSSVFAQSMDSTSSGLSVHAMQLHQHQHQHQHMVPELGEDDATDWDSVLSHDDDGDILDSVFGQIDAAHQQQPTDASCQQPVAMVGPSYLPPLSLSMLA